MVSLNNNDQFYLFGRSYTSLICTTNSLVDEALMNKYEFSCSLIKLVYVFLLFTFTYMLNQRTKWRGFVAHLSHLYNVISGLGCSSDHNDVDYYFMCYYLPMHVVQGMSYYFLFTLITTSCVVLIKSNIIQKSFVPSFEL